MRKSGKSVPVRPRRVHRPRGPNRLVRRAPPRRTRLSDTRDPAVPYPAHLPPDHTPPGRSSWGCGGGGGGGVRGGGGGREGRVGQDRTSEGSSRYRRLSSSCSASITWS